MSIFRSIFILCLCVSMLQGCGPSEEELRLVKLNAEIADAKAVVKKLGVMIEGNRIANTNILKLYGQAIRVHRPETSELVNALIRDATTSGPTYQNLLSRLHDAEKASTPALKGGSEAVSKALAELYSIQKASTPALYNMMLTDPINVLADMSDGLLSRVESLSSEEAKTANSSGDLASGNQLVGNPNYGSWQTHRNGNSFWVFYGQYAMLSSLFGRGPMYYDSWSHRRPYSYYHDYGRSSYNSPRQTAAQKSIESKTASKFSQQGKRFQSPYASQRKTTASAVNKTTRASQSFQSSYGKKLNSRSSGSVRNSSSQSSRSSRSGK